jgi:hypothetical protein
MATSLHAFYGLLAILPLLALPLLMGGVTVGEFWRVTAVLIATLALSLAVGMLVSAVSRDTRQAMAGTLLVVVVLSGLLPVLWWLIRLLVRGATWDGLLLASPPYLYSRAFDVYFRFRTGEREFWESLATICAVSGGALVLASWCLPRLWQEKGEKGFDKGGDNGFDKGRGGERRSWWWRRRFGTAEFRAGRRVCMGHDPYYWLASRDRAPRWLAWGILGPLLPIWLCFLAGCSMANVRKLQICFPVAMFMSYGLHQVVKWLMAMEASRRLSEDRNSGALELLLVTPISAEAILAGQRRALWEIFRGPMVLALLINAGL